MDGDESLTSMTDIRKIRFYHLQKQNLIQKASANSYPGLLKKHLGLHSTDYLTPYFSLWARIENFDPARLFKDLNQKQAFRIRAFRGTLFVVHEENLKIILEALEYFLAGRRKEAQQLAGKVGLDLESAQQTVTELLKKHSELTTSEIKKALPGDIKGEVLTLLMRHLEFNAIIIRTTQRYLTDPVIKYALTSSYLPDLNLNEINPELALDEISFRYIQQFGPVCLDDLAWWLPVSKTQAKNILLRLKTKLATFQLPGRDYFMEETDYHEFQSCEMPENTEPLIHLLPYEDHFPKAYRVRDWYISSDVTPSVFHVGKIDYGPLRPSIWLNGEIIGRWEVEWLDQKSSAGIKIFEMEQKISANDDLMRLIRRECDKLADFINVRLTPLMRKN